jgi:hypothetical protein
MQGSPALTFSPLPTPKATPKNDSLYTGFKRRYEAYKNIVVRPFFRDHFARLDRQIILVDALQALNAGSEATKDLQIALSEVLSCFRVGSNNMFLDLIAKKIDKIAIAATKADHLHHTSHDDLQAIVNSLVSRAMNDAKFSGAQVKSFALASIRATSEETRTEGGQELNLIVGTPQKGEKLGKQIFDGKTEIALFPGDLPKASDLTARDLPKASDLTARDLPKASDLTARDLPKASDMATSDLPQNSEEIFQENTQDINLNFMRFLPPKKLKTDAQGNLIFPHIRLDQTLQFLIADKIK